MVYTDNRTIELNSYSGVKKNGTLNSSVDFNFTGLLKDESDIMRSYISIVNAQLPVSFYVINASNNFINVQTTGFTLQTITIPKGNYNSLSLLTALNNALSAVSIACTISINKSNGCLTFLNTSSPSITFYATNTKMNYVLGFTDNLIIISSLTLTRPLNLLGVKRIAINSFHLATSGYTSYDLGFSNTLATIPVDQAPFNMISYVNANTSNNLILRLKYIDAIDIQIVDELGNYIDFNGIDWSITLILSIERRDSEKLNLDMRQTIADANKNLEPPKEEPPQEESKDEQELNILTK